MPVSHRTVLFIECLHAAVVMAIVFCATAIYLLKSRGFPSDLLGFVYGGGLTYAGARVASTRLSLLAPNNNSDDA